MSHQGSKLPAGFWLKTREHMKAQYESQREIERRQLNRLKNILNHAYDNVSFYKRKFKENSVHPDDIETLNDMEKLPIIGKTELIKEFPDGVLSLDSGSRVLGQNTTSGTSGIPFNFFNDAGDEAVGHILASRFMFNQMAGIKPGEKCIHLATNPSLIMENVRELQIAALGKTKKDMVKIRNLIEAYQPSGIGGITSTISLLASCISESGSLKKKPKAVFITAEMLLNSYRKKIESAFDSEVYDRYGTKELNGYMAQECSYHNGLHVNTEISLLEIVKDGEPVSTNERGRIVLTDLHNFVMPFIRFDVGDYATRLDGCTCGRSFPVIRDIEGRFANNLRGSGNILIPLLPVQSKLATRFSRLIEQFQFIQEKAGRVRLLISPSEKFVIGDEKAIEAFLNAITSTIEFSVDVVKEIPADSSGKRPILRGM
jgi:phenylacetate-CoA ligase